METNKKDLILDTASKVFALYGYKKTAMQDIGDELNMTKSNLYIYFKNKEDLYIKTVSYQLLKWRNHVESTIIGEKSSVEKFKLLCKASFEYIKDNDTLKDLVEKDESIFAINHDSDRFIEINQIAQQMIKDVLSEGIEKGEIRELDIDNISEYIFSTYMMFLTKLYSKKDKYTTEKLVDDVIELLCMGIESR